MLRVLSLPGRHQHNQYFDLFCDALEKEQMKVVNIRDWEALSFQFDILHLHFPTHFITQTGTFAAIFFAIFLSGLFLTMKLLGKKIIYTVHNVIPFNVHREWLLWPYLRFVHRLCDGYVFLNRTSRAEFCERFPEEQSKPFTVIAHGPYPVTILDEQTRLQKRRELVPDTNAFLVGLLGNIKPYKNVDALLSLPSHLSDGRPVRAVVVGRIESGYREKAEATLRRIPPDVLVRIDKSPSDTELNELIQIVDVVLLPYSKGWNSGAALLVLSNRGKILASDLPVFTELESVVGKPWVQTFQYGPEIQSPDLSTPIEEVARLGTTAESQDRLSAFIDRSSFSSGAQALKAFYQERLGTRRRLPTSASNASAS